jgi:hypothetical protein
MLVRTTCTLLIPAFALLFAPPVLTIWRAQAKVDEGMVALVNVKTDYRARFGGVAFSDYST